MSETNPSGAPQRAGDGNITAGLVCSHHHLYSSLARGMPAPPEQPKNFLQILQQVWWRLDAALDHEMLRWSAKLGALEALQCGTTAIVDHHESPSCIEGSLAVIAEACAEVGVRVNCCYGITDRWTDGGKLLVGFDDPPTAMTAAARRALAESVEFIRGGGRGMIGVHAAFTCADETLAAAASSAADLGVPVHIHVAEGPVDERAGRRLAKLAAEDWLLVHAVHLRDQLPGVVVHNARSNMNNAVGYARPTLRTNPIALGTDGIGGDMLEEFRIAFARLREYDVAASPDTVWGWLEEGRRWFPETANDRVTWSYDHTDSPWHVAYTPAIRAERVMVDGEIVLDGGLPTRVDIAEVRAKAAEQAERLFARL